VARHLEAELEISVVRVSPHGAASDDAARNEHHVDFDFYHHRTGVRLLATNAHYRFDACADVDGYYCELDT